MSRGPSEYAGSGQRANELSAERAGGRVDGRSNARAVKLADSKDALTNEYSRGRADVRTVEVAGGRMIEHLDDRSIGGAGRRSDGRTRYTTRKTP